MQASGPSHNALSNVLYARSYIPDLRWCRVAPMMLKRKCGINPRYRTQPCLMFCFRAQIFAAGQDVDTSESNEDDAHE